MKVLFVGGTFDDDGGKSSKIIHKIACGVIKKANQVAYFNGGYFYRLLDIYGKATSEYQENPYDIIFWFPNVPNDKPKLIKGFKRTKIHPILICSKRNIDGKYSFEDLQYRAFENKANLMLEFSAFPNRYEDNGKPLICGTISDPLGNRFLSNMTDFERVGESLFKLASQIRGYTRISTSRLEGHSAIPHVGSAKELTEFCEIVKEYAEEFHDIVHVHPNAVNRFFGNASMRAVNGIYVTKRNTDKRNINEYSFVKVRQVTNIGKLGYFGDHKPSIDAPAHVKIFERYKNIKYIVHLHCYLDGNRKTTNKVIPCGALEEFDAIKTMYPDPDTKLMLLNLKGHGCLIMADCVEKLDYWNFIPRPMPEIHHVW